MSELKGQLIGIILTITIFLAVGGITLKAYKESAGDVADQVSGSQVFVEPQN